MVYVNKELLSCALWDSINLKVKSKVFQGQLPLFLDKQKSILEYQVARSVALIR